MLEWSIGGTMKKSKDLSVLDYSLEKGISIQDRVIRLTGEIGEDFDFDFVDFALSELERDSKANITIRMCSGGGDVYEALAIAGRIKESRAHITTVGYGQIMSAATLILACGNFRKISEFCTFMTHEASYDIGGRHSDVREEVEQMEREENLWCKYMEKFSNKTADWWRKVATKRNYYMTAEQVLECGVADKVI